MDRPPQPHRVHRDRTTRRGALIAERAARATITIGGIGTIVAVSLIFVFLLWVVFPLFMAGEVRTAHDVPAPGAEAPPVHLDLDESRHLACAVHADGRIELVRVDTGEVLDVRRPFGDGAPTAMSFSTLGDDVVFGFADGVVRLGRIGFGVSFLGESEATPELRALGDVERGRPADEKAVLEGGLVERTPEGQLRRTELDVTVEDALSTGHDASVEQISHATTPTGLYVLARHADASLRMYRVRERRNVLTKKVTRTLSESELPEPAASASPVARLLLAGSAQTAYLVHEDGALVQWDLRDPEAPVIGERIDIVPEEGERVTAVEMLLGGTTLLVGDSLGRLRGWFPRPVAEDGEVEGGPEELRLARAHELPGGAAAVTAIAPSARSRIAVAGHANGALSLVHVTSHARLVSVSAAGAVRATAIAPKEDGIVAWSAGRLYTWAVDPGYPEASPSALFLPVWYEGYPEPAHVWQSSSGTDDFEPKLGITPLVFGTIKATLYSLLFGAPIALLAAIFTSEFLHARIRSSVKSTIELMASLPSVVLGFLAALVIAPYVQALLPGVLAMLFVVPIAVLAGAYLWQLLPQRLALRWAGWQRFLAIGLAFPAGGAAALLLGPLLEGLLFAGDSELWLDGRVGSGAGGWFFLLLPVCGIATAMIFARTVSPRLRAASMAWDRRRCARADLLKFTSGLAIAAGAAALLAGILTAGGVDVRGSVVDTYVQRNALVVGFVMGFAIIPIIYTLAEDALSEVPQHLREASLGAGATPWQTASRIVIPTAMSGIFSALMIGLGRAVGETMIVLMAAGNTPIMELNVFNGFRTLSANIAVELPEAVRNSAHYRTLFLAALVLFAMTFALNTVAELVRRHFRKKTQAL